MNPLADRMRPKTLDQFIGQKHILDTDKLLYKAIKSDQLFSMILWGPPGVGKTTLARVIAGEVNADFLEFSAVTTGIAELKKIFTDLTEKQKKPLQIMLTRGEDETKSPSSGSEIAMLPSVARNEEGKRQLFSSSQRSGGEKTIVFIDEIHRFNKAQQDAFLPYVENGTIILIGATTENPSFEVIGPLLSRTRVFILQQFTTDELKEVVGRALSDKVNGLGNYKAKLKPDAMDFLIEGSNGDARIILNTLEIAVLSTTAPVILSEAKDIYSSAASQNDTKKEQNVRVIISKQDVEEALQRRSLSYDKGGEEHYNTISAFIKSMRASQADAALYYLARMVEVGEDPLFIARRMVIFASEDIGMAQPTALVVANEVFRACETIGYPECQINLAHGVVYLCRAKKDRSAYEAYFEALNDVKQHGNLEIPLNIRNAPTKLMKEVGYGKNYQKYDQKSYLPEKLKNKKYYKR